MRMVRSGINFFKIRLKDLVAFLVDCFQGGSAHNLYVNNTGDEGSKVLQLNRKRNLPASPILHFFLNHGCRGCLPALGRNQCDVRR